MSEFDLAPVKRFGSGSVMPAQVICSFESVVVVGYTDGYIRAFDPSSGRSHGVMHVGHGLQILSLTFSEDGRFLFSGCRVGNVKIWDATSWKCLRTIVAHEKPVFHLASLGNGVVSGCEDELKVWSEETEAPPVSFSLDVASLAVSGSELFCGSSDGIVAISDAKTGKLLRKLLGHDGRVTCLAISGESTIAGSIGGTIRIWNSKSTECLGTLVGHDEVVLFLTVFEGRVLSGSFDGTLKVWEVSTGNLLKSFETGREMYGAVVIPEGKFKDGDKIFGICDFRFLVFQMP